MSPPAARVEPYASIAPVYDRLIGDAGLVPIWRAFRHSCRVHRLSFTSVADIACGTGRFLGRLAQLGGPALRLYGVDRSPAMLALARHRLGERRVVLLCQDLRRLSLPSPVDLLTCNFSSINYVVQPTELSRAFDHFRRNLRFNGVVLFDTMLKTNAVPVGSPFRQIIALPDLRAVWDIRPSADEGGSVVAMRSCLRGPDRAWRCTRELHVQRWWPRATLEEALHGAALRVLGVHRLGDHRPAGPTDRWVQFVAQRS